MKEKVIMNEWKRKDVFEFFNNFEDPYAGIITPIEITIITNYIKNKNISITEMISYIILKSVNEVEDFKYCLEDGNVYKYDKINLSLTVLNSQNIMQYTNVIEYDADINKFLKTFRKEKHDAELECKEPEQLSANKIYISCLPWFRVISIKHPSYLKEIDSVPRITWSQIN